MFLSIQLYTVRDETAKNFSGTLEKLAAIGYKGVEFAGYGDLPAQEMKSILGRLGLKPIGSHVRISRLKENLEEEIEYNKTIGSEYIICSRNDYENPEAFLKAAELYDRIGEKCRANGMEFCYHNHAHEFEKVNDEYGMDIIYGNSDPGLVKAEIDVCWVQKAGLEPDEYIRKYANRCPLIHLKDRKAGDEVVFTEVGNGILSFDKIINASKQSGAKYFIVEQDRCEIPCLESARISFENIKKMNLL